jgi:hypothetical protein
MLPRHFVPDDIPGIPVKGISGGWRVFLNPMPETFSLVLEVDGFEITEL